MRRAENPAHSPDSSPFANLSALSRNASVISTSSSDSGPSPLPLRAPRPMRTFSAPRSQSPNARTPRSSIPPSYLAEELGIQTVYNGPPGPTPSLPAAGARSGSRPRNAGATVDDFRFGATLGEGSYSTVSLQYLYLNQKA